MKGLMELFEAANKKLHLSVAFLLFCLIGLVFFSHVEAITTWLAVIKIVLGICVLFAIAFVALALNQLHCAMQKLRVFYAMVEQVGK